MHKTVQSLTISLPGNQWFNGDGNISAFRFKDGNVHFRQKYVRTEKFTKERQAQRALAGMLTLRSNHPSQQCPA